MVKIDKIISGGQTGADRAVLDFAIANGIPYGGAVTWLRFFYFKSLSSVPSIDSATASSCNKENVNLD